MSECYENIENLFDNLQQIKEIGMGELCLPKALYIIAEEIKKIKWEIEQIKDRLNYEV